MIFKIRNFINLLIVVLIFILLPIEVNAHKQKHNHIDEKQTGIKPGGSTYQLAVINPAPDFALVDIKGEKTRLKDLNGKIKIINFIYTFCPDVCPIATGRLSKLQDMLRKEGLLGKEVEIISISLDPERDTPEQLKKYANGFKADGNGWLFLRGTKEQTKKVLSDYDIWSKKLDDGTIDHVMRVYLIDGKDRIREIYNLGFLQPELVVRDIEMILTEK
ncbi:MAG TPA: SCO family protein [Thermodesulfobacteriota bacterium]|nr:SCO family protein [Thermodesulfobacteriota bacterium]